MNFNDIYSDVIQFCSKISVDKNLIGKVDEFEGALVKVLSDSNLNKAKKYTKPNGRKNGQTHFDITGLENMKFFFSSEAIEKFKEDKKKIEKNITIELISNNEEYIKVLDSPIEVKKKNLEGKMCKFVERKVSELNIKYSDKKIHSSQAILKLGHNSQNPQVQINKLDNKDKFYKLRKIWYKGDRVILLKHRCNTDRYLCIIIPNIIIDEFKSLSNYKRGNNIITNETNNDLNTKISTSSVDNIKEEDELGTKDYLGISLNDIDESKFIPKQQFPQHKSDNLLKEDTTKYKSNTSKLKKGKDYLAEHARKKEIGDFGERLILHNEKLQLKNSDIEELRKKSEDVEWSSNEKGDGLGYDIKSYDISENGDIIDKFIEVKTTLGADKAFEITAAEVEKSEELNEMGKYVIARVYNVDLESMTFNYYCEDGPIRSNYKLSPISYLASKN